MPSHNLREVAAAAVALLKNDKLWPTTSCSRCCPAPTTRAAARSSAAPKTSAPPTRSGRGTLKVRARWKIEDLARGQWQLVVTELPPGTSTQKVLEEIEELTNPKVKAGKKALSPEQMQLKATRARGARRGARRVEQGRAGAPGVRAQDAHASTQHELITTLLAHTSLESSAPINLTMVGADGRPTQKSLRQMLAEWIAVPPGHGRSGARSTGWARCWTASTSSKAGSWCCSTSTR